MAHESYKQALQTAQSEITELLQKRAEIDKQISKLAPAIEYLSSLCDALPMEPSMPSALDMGLADAIRLAFKSALPSSLSPTEVRDKLREQGFNLDRYANELPPIHNTIMRLLKQGEIEEDVPRREGKTYKWVSSLKRALLEIEPGISGPTLKERLSLSERIEAGRRLLMEHAYELTKMDKGKSRAHFPRPRRGFYGSPPVTEETK